MYLPHADIVVKSHVFGLITTVAVVGLLEQQLFVAVKVNVTVIGAFVVLVKDPVTFPEPLAAIPVTVAVLSRVQA